MKSCKFLSFLLVLTIIFSTFSVPVFASENDIDSNEDTIFADNASSNKEDEVDEEAIRDFVTRLYSICLNREPDSIGLDGWTQSLVDKKATGCSVAYGFVFSPEFQSLQVTNSEYVKYMYDAFFGRNPDVEGFNYWVDLLDKGMTREEIYCGFANSLEFSNLCKSFGVVRGYHVLGNDFNKNALVNLFVERLYNVVLNRTCDDEGMAGWTTYLVDHSKSGYEVAYGFVFSPEFINRNLCNNHFVEVMYEAFLGRSSDATGKAYWVDFLDNGSTRKEIFNGFAGSIEFAAICDSYGIEAGNIDTTPVTDISASGPCTMCEETNNGGSNSSSSNPTSSPSGNGGSITIITTPSVSFGDGNQTSGQTQNPGQPTNPGQSANQTTNQSTSQPSNPTPGQSTNPSQSSNPSQTPVPGTTTTPTVSVVPEQPSIAPGPLTPEPINFDSMFAVPYVSTYYFNPQPSPNDNIQIPIYMTDYYQSEYLFNDTSAKVDLIYEIDQGGEKVIKDLPLGDYTLTLGKLSKGKHVFSVQVLDNRTGLRSPKIFNDLWVRDASESTMNSTKVYYMTQADLTTYNIHNNNSTKYQDCVDTRNGLNLLFKTVKEKGYNKIVLLKGTYRVAGENGDYNEVTCIMMPSEFTVDMNGSTFKLDTITTLDIFEQNYTFRVGACIVKFNNCVDSHLINGTLEGDRFERQALGLETGFYGEMIMTVVMEGGKYCSLDNLTIKNTTGHTVGCGCVWGPRLMMTNYTENMIIIDGKEVARENCSTSSMIDLTEIINWDKDENYIYVGHPEGYRGIMCDSAVIYVSFYDQNKNYIKTVTGYQYRKMEIPSNAKYARVSLLGTNIPTSGYDGTVSIYTKHFENYSEIVNCDFIDTRSVALCPSAAMSLLIENNTFTRCGNSITKLCVDFEDGAQECQDMYYRNNTVLETGNANCTVVSCFGFNHVIENNINHSVEIRYGVVGGVVRNMPSVNSIAWQLGNGDYARYGRLENCGTSQIRFIDHSLDTKECASFAISNCIIGDGWVETVPGKVVFENCTITNLRGANDIFHNCVIKSAPMLGDKMYFYDCRFVPDSTGKGTLIFASDSKDNMSRIIDHCTFEGASELTGKDHLHSVIVRDSTFDDLKLSLGTHKYQGEILFENCDIKSSVETFMYFGPWAFSVENIHVTFRDCTITHTGKTFMYFLAKPTDRSTVLFEGCTIIKDSGSLVGWSNDHRMPEFIDNIDVTLTFRDTEVNRNLIIDTNTVGTNHFKVVFED